MRFFNGQTVASILAITLPLCGILWSAILWAADQRYVEKTEVDRVVQEIRLDRLNDDIDLLELQDNLGELSAVEQAQLEKLKRKRGETIDNLRRE